MESLESPVVRGAFEANSLVTEQGNSSVDEGNSKRQ